MPDMVFSGRIQTGISNLDVGITDLLVAQGASGLRIYSSSGQLGGLSAFSVSGTGTASFLDHSFYDAAWADGVLRNLALISVNGGTSVAVAASGQHQLRLFDLAGDGSIGSGALMNGMNVSNQQITDVSQWGSDILFMTDTATGEIQGYTVSGSGTMTQSITLADTANTYVRSAIALETVQVSGVQFLISVSQAERGISSFYIDPTNKLFNVSNQGVNEGLGIMVPTAAELVQVGNRAFVIVASSPDDAQGQSGALTVLEIGVDGMLVPVEHLNDTLNTRFGRVQTLEVIEHGGRHYVIAGGGDDGLTLFVMMPSGRLQLLDVLEPGATVAMNNVSATAAFMQGSMMRIYAASEMETGFADISVNLSQQGSTILSGHNGGTRTGTALDDIMVGGAGNDSLVGGAGNDLIEDGYGNDTLNGGDGTDTYILRADGQLDRIVDFQPGIDRLDLSDWPMFYDPGQIGYTATATGATLTWRSETLEIFTRNGATLTSAQVQAAILQTADRAPNFDAIMGNSGAQNITGTSLDDVYVTGAGNDTVTGGLGNDYIDSGDDHDWIEGGNGNDTLIGGSGNDRLIGGISADSLSGNAGNDTLEGGEGADTLVGGSDNDLLFGGGSTDILLGGSGFDTMDGGEGSDLYYVDGGDLLTDTGTVGYDTAQILSTTGDYINLAGWSGIERLDGNIGNDYITAAGLASPIFLFGSAGNDTIIGGTGNDTILGGDGNDILSGGAGNDILQGGTGNDTFFGGDGHDVFYVGEAGDVVSDGGGGFDIVLINAPGGLDLTVGSWAGVERYVGYTGDDRINAAGSNDHLTLIGGFGNDTLIGGNGRDTIYADDGNDVLEGGVGNDVLIAGAGADRLVGGAGDDFLLGGLGADVFVFGNNFGHDVVKDFLRGTDILDMSGIAGVNGLSDLVISSSGGHTLITLSGGGPDMITLAEYSSGLGSADFLF